MVGLWSEARLWNSGSGGKATQIENYVKELNKEMVCLWSEPRFGKSWSGSQAAKIEFSVKGFNNKTVGLFLEARQLNLRFLARDLVAKLCARGPA